MSAFEQKREIPNRALQYMVVCPLSLSPADFMSRHGVKVFWT
jgi:hypothetical protein